MRWSGESEWGWSGAGGLGGDWALNWPTMGLKNLVKLLDPAPSSGAIGRLEKLVASICVLASMKCVGFASRHSLSRG